MVGNLVPVGHGLAARPDAAAVAGYVKQADAQKTVDFFLHIIPDAGRRVRARRYPAGAALRHAVRLCAMALGERGQQMRDTHRRQLACVFGMIAIVMKVAPFGAFGAMAYTIGKFGPAALGNLVGPDRAVLCDCPLFVFVVLGTIARVVGFNIFRFIVYIRDELLIVLGTWSSESALPQLMGKLERLGCSKSVVGLVVPTGYSFNLDGTNIYMTMATMFIAQALGIELTFMQQLTMLGVAMLTSKGATGVTGAGFITLAATLAVVNPALVPGMAIVFSVDKFMSEVRALTNITGNGIASVFVSWWEGELDHDRLHANLNRTLDPSDLETAVTTG